MARSLVNHEHVAVGSGRVIEPSIGIRKIDLVNVSKSGVANRFGKILINYLRSCRGQTTPVAFWARARRRRGVSVPISCDLLPSLNSGSQWAIATGREELSFAETDRWTDCWKSRQILAATRKTLKIPPLRA
ncbi:MAG: hypothetical protein HY020_06945 [Burkholderiales bacterium]|nr:hypothetical protein [Burkholderiales bacterium]